MSNIDPDDDLKQQMTKAKERFASDAEGATMTVLKDDGAYRHLDFRFPKASWDWCEVVTWPGMLVLRGGLGYWSFTRVEDMLAFFRPTQHSTRIDPEHWAEKLAPYGRKCAMEFTPERAAAYLRLTVSEYADEFPGLAQDVEDSLFAEWGGADLGTEIGLREAVGRFEGAYQDIYKGFRFRVEEWDLHRYSQWFLMTCVALPWVVMQYDAAAVPVG